MKVVIFTLIFMLSSLSYALEIKAGYHNNFYRIILNSKYDLEKVEFFDDNYLVFKTKDVNIKKIGNLDRSLIKKIEVINTKRENKIVFKLSKSVNKHKVYRINKKFIIDIYKNIGAKKIKSKKQTKDNFKDPIARIILNSNTTKTKKSINTIKLNTDPLYSLIVKELSKEENLKIIRPVVVVIDPGHGGKDPGAIANGLREKDITLKLARKLKEILEEKKIFKVYLTRSGDYYVDLYSRTVFAVRKKADIFISIHCNADRSGSGSGTYIYTLNLRGAKSKLARIVEKRENKAVMKIVKVSKNSYVNRIVAELAINTTMTEGRNFAYILKEKLKNITNVKAIDSANFAVLKTPGIPSVLIETAYLTNKNDANLLKDPKFLDNFAVSIYKAIESYFFNYKNVVLNR